MGQSVTRYNTFIHGPFNFAVINGRQTRDRIDSQDWTQLKVAQSKYDDAPPDLDKRVFTGVQFSRSFHSSYSDPLVHARVMATHSHTPETYSTLHLNV